jgi:L-fucose mutarotase
MLKGIPKIIAPDLLKILAEMGHGDEIVLADGNFPAASMGQRVVRCDASDGPELLDGILQLFPLDTFVPRPVGLMQVVPGDNYTPAIWEKYLSILAAHGHSDVVEYIERFAFYDRTRKAYAVVATGEMARYANVILKKGIVE